MKRNPILSINQCWLQVLPITAALYAGQVNAAEKDYYVHFSNFLDSHPAGTIANDIGGDIFESYVSGTCGILIKHVDVISWHFYGANSTPAIESADLDKDVIVYLKNSGCANDGQVRININDTDVLPDGGAADYVILEGGNTFIAVDSNGEPLDIDSGAIGSQLPNFLDEPFEPPFMKVIAHTLAQIKKDLLSGDPTSVLPYKANAVNRYINTRLDLLNQEMARVNRDPDANIHRHNYQAISQHMNQMQLSMNRCVSHYHESQLNRAYVQCDIAQQQLESIMSRHDVFAR